MDETVPARLRRLARTPVLPGEEHRRALETQIASRFGSARKESTVHTVLFRSTVVAGLLAAVGAGASQVPATYQAEVGKHVEIRTDAPPEPGAIRAAIRAIEGNAGGERRAVRVRVRVEATPDGSLAAIDVHGDTIGMEGIPDAIRKAVPSLAGARITVQPVEGSVEGDLGGMVGTKVLGERLSAAQIEAEVRRDLAAAGVDGSVSVEVKEDQADGESRREVRVIVTKEKEEGGAR